MNRDENNIGKTENDEIFEKVAAEKRRKLDEFLKGLEQQEQSARRNEDMRQTIHHDLFTKEHRTPVRKEDTQIRLDDMTAQAMKGAYSEEKPQPVRSHFAAAPVKELPDEEEEDDVKIYAPGDKLKSKPQEVKTLVYTKPISEPEPEPESEPETAEESIQTELVPQENGNITDSDSEPSAQEALQKARKEKMDNFVLNPEYRDDAAGDEVEDDFEYTPKSDAEEITSDLRAWRKKRLVKLVVCAVCLVASLIMVLAPALPSGLVKYSLASGQETASRVPDEYSQAYEYTDSSEETEKSVTLNENAGQVRIILALLLLINAIVFAVSYDTMSNGTLDFIRFSASCDSTAAVVWLFTSLQLIILIIAPDKSNFATGVFGVLAPFAPFSALICHFTGYLRQTRELNGFEVISQTHPAMHLQLQNEGNSVMLEQPAEDSEGCCTGTFVKSDFASDYFAVSDAEDGADRINRIIVPSALVAGLVLGIIAMFVGGMNAGAFLPVCTAVICTVTPIASGIACLLPQARASKTVKPYSIAICNQSAFEETYDMTSLVLTDSEIFNPGSMVLNGIKTFGGKRMDEAMVLAASAVEKHGGPLREMFASILSENEEYLLDVENETAFEPEQGMVCWMNGHRVILGSREFLQQYDIELPDTDFDSKYAKRNRSLLYLAQGSELMALLVVTYKIDTQTARALRSLAEKGIKICVNASDPGLKAALICRQLGLEDDAVTVLDARGRETAQKLAKPLESCRAGVVCRDMPLDKMRAVSACFRLKKMVSLGSAFQIGMLALGLVICLINIIGGDLSGLSLPMLIGYQAGWLALLCIVQLFGRYDRI